MIMHGGAGLEEDGYDSELVGDEADRARLNKMSELDREMILAERSEAREQAKERRRQAQMVEQRTRDTRAIDKVGHITLRQHVMS